MSVESCSKCGNPLDSKGDVCHACDDALLVPVVPELPDDTTEPESETISEIVESDQEEEHEPHKNAGSNKNKYFLVASLLVVAMVVGVLFSFTDIFGRNSRSDAPDEEVSRPDYIEASQEEDVSEQITYADRYEANNLVTSLELLELSVNLNRYFNRINMQSTYAFLDERGLVINIQASDIFNDGLLVMSRTGTRALYNIYTQISRYPIDRLDFIGYSDNLSMLFVDTESFFGTNIWFSNVVDEFWYANFDNNATMSISHSFSGSYDPIVSNATAEGRKINNRVEIIIEHIFESSFLEMYSTNPRESINASILQNEQYTLDSLISEIVGLWQSEWIDEYGAIHVRAITFGNDYEFSIMQWFEYSEPHYVITDSNDFDGPYRGFYMDLSGSYEIDILKRKIHFVGQDNITGDDVEYFYNFMFIRNHLLLNQIGEEPYIFSKTESPDS